MKGMINGASYVNTVNGLKSAQEQISKEIRVLQNEVNENKERKNRNKGSVKVKLNMKHEQTIARKFPILFSIIISGPINQNKNLYLFFSFKIPFIPYFLIK